MKRLLIFCCAVILMTGCSQKVAEPSPGKTLGEIYVSAQSGAKSILVNLDGVWRVRSLSDWISVDVNGREGKNAFTLYYGSNESDFAISNNTRKGCVVIQSLTSMIADSLYILQQGIPDGKEHTDIVVGSYIEYRECELFRIKAIFANVVGGGAGDIDSFIESSDAQVIGLIVPDGFTVSSTFQHIPHGNLVFVNKSEYQMCEITRSDSPVSIAVKVDGINFHLSDFGETISPEDNRYSQTERLLECGYRQPEFGNKWVIGGSLYYYSVMESNYQNTPSWYPTDPRSAEFFADINVQSNNLTDCIWSSSRKYSPTFSSGGRNWRADYIYASNSIWNATVQTSIDDLGIQGTNHKSLGIVLKYEHEKD